MVPRRVVECQWAGARRRWPGRGVWAARARGAAARSVDGRGTATAATALCWHRRPAATARSAGHRSAGRVVRSGGLARGPQTCRAGPLSALSRCAHHVHVSGPDGTHAARRVSLSRGAHVMCRPEGSRAGLRTPSSSTGTSVAPARGLPTRASSAGRASHAPAQTHRAGRSGVDGTRTRGPWAVRHRRADVGRPRCAHHVRSRRRCGPRTSSGADTDGRASRDRVGRSRGDCAGAASGDQAACGGEPKRDPRPWTHQRSRGPRRAPDPAQRSWGERYAGRCASQAGSRADTGRPGARHVRDASPMRACAAPARAARGVLQGQRGVPWAPVRAYGSPGERYAPNRRLMADNVLGMQPARNQGRRAGPPWGLAGGARPAGHAAGHGGGARTAGRTWPCGPRRENRHRGRGPPTQSATTSDSSGTPA